MSGAQKRMSTIDVIACNLHVLKGYGPLRLALVKHGHVVMVAWLMVEGGCNLFVKSVFSWLVAR